MMAVMMVMMMVMYLENQYIPPEVLNTVFIPTPAGLYSSNPAWIWRPPGEYAGHSYRSAPLTFSNPYACGQRWFFLILLLCIASNTRRPKGCCSRRSSYCLKGNIAAPRTTIMTMLYTYDLYTFNQYHILRLPCERLVQSRHYCQRQYWYSSPDIIFNVKSCHNSIDIF